MNEDDRLDALERAEYAEMQDDRAREEIEALRVRIRDLENRLAAALLKEEAARV